ncbi:MAG: hypothetical protein IJE97_05430 [Thermoguttaceae bacterium]|nr:hypothetical protein [Thermoguttaceae bacterium]
MKTLEEARNGGNGATRTPELFRANVGLRKAFWGFVVEKKQRRVRRKRRLDSLEATVGDWRLASRTSAATDLRPTRRIVDYNASSDVAPRRNCIRGGGGSTPGPLYR